MEEEEEESGLSSSLSEPFFFGAVMLEHPNKS